jgi:hypothetical protein
MSWLLLAIGSYFLSAFSSTVDKVLLRERIPQPHVYAFYSGILSIGVVVLLPVYTFAHAFNGSSIAFTGRTLLLPWSTTLLALLAGGFFVPAIYFFYVALKRVTYLVSYQSLAAQLLLYLSGFRISLMGRYHRCIIFLPFFCLLLAVLFSPLM